MEALKIGTAVVGIWLAGYDAGAWYGGRQADQRWTASGIRSYVYQHHQGNTVANELSIACDDIEYVYRVGATAVRERPTRGSTAVATLLPKLTRNEAFTGATVLTGLTKVQDLSAVVEPISNKAHWTV